MSDVPRPQETARPQGEGSGAGQGASDSTSPAGARLGALRAGPAGAVPDAVWEDASAQLTGMLDALTTLAREVPVLASPPDSLDPLDPLDPRVQTDGGAAPGTPLGAGGR